MDQYEAFASIYDRWSASMTEDVAFYVDLARNTNGPIVELAVGTGRVAIHMAAAAGRTVIGIDASPAMLAIAREHAEKAEVELDLRLGDMRELSLDEPAALITCPFRSLLHLPTWADRRRVFERVAASLAPGGRFAWNAFAFDPKIAVERDGKWHNETGIPHRLDYIPADNRVAITLEDGNAIRLWWIARSEWEGLIDIAGLEVEALYGWFDRRPFDDASTEFVYVARKRA
jgi:YD repeat-containing protein